MDEFCEIVADQIFCNGKAVMREAVMEMLEAEAELHRGSEQSMIRYLIKKVERLEAERKENADRCVSCGEIIPEGRMVCPNCLLTVKENDDG